MKIKMLPKRYLLKSRLEFQEGVEGLEGIEVLQERKDWRCRCAEYVFGTLMHEKWIEPLQLPPLGLWYDTANFLESKGYRKIHAPEDYDIIVYFDFRKRNFSFRKEAVHFGIYEDNKIISKFGAGSIYIHDIDMVDPLYGREVKFFRKMK